MFCLPLVQQYHVTENNLTCDPPLTVMTKGAKVYGFYPSSTGVEISCAESGVPSTSVSVTGKIISKLDYQSSTTIGISVTRGSTSAVPATNARIIIGRDPSMPGGYKIITGYPTQ